MPYIPLRLTPGMLSTGTVYEARGRWFQGNLVRFVEHTVKPWGAWSKMQHIVETDPVAEVEDIDLEGPIRSTHAWRNRGAEPFLAMGTHDSIQVFRAGFLVDITPEDLEEGLVDATFVAGLYGVGLYNVGVYGMGIMGLEGDLVEANTWQIDNYGEVPVAVSYADRRLLIWEDPDTDEDPMVVLSNSPSSVMGVVVTPERFIVALGASGDQRLVAWADQEDIEDWTPTNENQAGDFTLVTSGSLLAGKRTRNETLLWTDVDLWAMRFVGGTFVYSFQKLGERCGAVSRQAMVVHSGQSMWMGKKAFFTYDGYVRPIHSDVADRVFNNFNRIQASKVVAYTRAEFHEVVWHYPSAGSMENDRYVVYNYLLNIWYTGRLERCAGVDSGVFGFPIATDARGHAYQMEMPIDDISSNFINADGTILKPFIESGPIEIEAGDQVYMLREIVPDVDFEGEVHMHVFTTFYPVDDETPNGPFIIERGKPTDVRMSARAVRLRIEHVSKPNSRSWRAGTFRIEAQPGGLR